MDLQNLGGLSARGLSLVRLDAGDWALLQETRRRGRRFSLSFPHETAHRARTRSLALVSVEGDRPSLLVGYVRSIQAVTTFDSRVSLDFVGEISPSILTALLSQITEGPLRAGAQRLLIEPDRLIAVSTKLGQRIVEIVGAEPSNGPPLQRILANLNRPKQFDNARAMQQDALGIALKAFGASEGATEIELTGQDTALATVHLQEDAVILHDARWAPGWRLSGSDLTGKAVFSRQSAKLQIFTANKLGLEQLFGVDLIYLNEARGSLVMVQYKMLDQGGYASESDERDWIARIDDQFREEINRMSRFARDLSPDGPYRLNTTPFYFKFVRRRSKVDGAGILISLEHLNQLISEGRLEGPRGGLRMTYTGLNGHYLRGESFVGLVCSGYIGTRGATTEHLQTLIDVALTENRAVVAAIESALPR